MKINTGAGLLAITSCLLLLFSCKKEDAVITGKESLELYTNSSGFDLDITTYMGGKTVKTFSVARDSILKVLNPMDDGSDVTGTIFNADSAQLLFSDGKKYTLINTVSTASNFLNKKNFKVAIAPSGQLYYYRYTISAAHYALAQ